MKQGVISNPEFIPPELLAQLNRGKTSLPMLMGLFMRLSHIAGPPGNDAVNVGLSWLGFLFNHCSWLPVLLPVAL